jgi:PleD family two-component response regulator
MERITEILLVDDEGHIRELLARWLFAEGFVITEVSDAESGLAVLDGKQFAVAMIDKDMPGYDGTWLVEQMGYLLKPFKRELVVAAVRDAVQWHLVAAKHSTQAPAADPGDSRLQGSAGQSPENET